jgi:hypothetical protein
MSKASTSFRVFYPNTNTLSALSLFDSTGAAITPSAIADGVGDPAGYLSKVITLATSAPNPCSLPRPSATPPPRSRSI